MALLGTSTKNRMLDQPSTWVQRFASLIPQGEVLDLACGNGRHSRLMAARGYPVLAVDRDAAALERAAGEGITVQQFDLEAETESGAGIATWPFQPRRFSGIVVTNYLHRPLFPHIFHGLAPGGVLIYETFAKGNEQFGKPSNPRFLLEPGELLQAVASDANLKLHVLAYEDGYVGLPAPAMVQRVCVVNAASDKNPERLRLV